MHNSEAELRVNDSFQKIKEELNSSEYCHQCVFVQFYFFDCDFFTFGTRSSQLFLTSAGVRLRIIDYVPYV